MATRKKFIDVELDLIQETTSILGTPSSLNNKTVKIDLTRRLKGKSLEITFKLKKHEDKLIALPQKMELMKFYIRRMMRKRTNYVEDSIKLECKDIRATIKPFLITRKKVSRAVRKNLRKTAAEFLKEKLKQRNYLDTCEDILTSELQRQLLPKLKKVYPLSLCEIRVFETKDIAKIKLKEPKPEPKKKVEKKEIKGEDTSTPKGVPPKGGKKPLGVLDKE